AWEPPAGAAFRSPRKGAEDQGAAGRQSKYAGRISAEAKGNALAALLPPAGCARSSRQLQLRRVGRILPRAEGAHPTILTPAMCKVASVPPRSHGRVRVASPPQWTRNPGLGPGTKN